MKSNIILNADFPDPDIIRVGETYYMVSTTMHFMPGCVLLKSYDLKNWEIVSYVYDTLEESNSYNLVEGENVYGQGMWAASLRHHNNTFYVCFSANDTQKTYLYRSSYIEGPWKRQLIEGFYHDNSLLFDDDGRTYIVYGNSEIFITELNEALTGPKEGGLHRLIIKEKSEVILGYEGSHIYKINNKYYIFLIHWLANGNKRRVQACYVSNSLEGEFVGKDVLDDDYGYLNSGVAQGGIVDTPEGDWFAMLFQDRGAIGRIPVLVPVEWLMDFPVFGRDGKVPDITHVQSTHASYEYQPVVKSDDFNYTNQSSPQLDLVWQWNHNPNHRLWSITNHPGCLEITTGKLAKNVTQAVNCLTQRLLFPKSEIIVTLDGSRLKNGDIAGLSAFQSTYSLVGLMKSDNTLKVVNMIKGSDPSPMGHYMDNSMGKIIESIPIKQRKIQLKLNGNFENGLDEIEYFYKIDKKWIPIGGKCKHQFTLDHFVGCRAGLFIYSTLQVGGAALFSDFNFDS